MRPEVSTGSTALVALAFDFGLGLSTGPDCRWGARTGRQCLREDGDVRRVQGRQENGTARRAALALSQRVRENSKWIVASSSSRPAWLPAVPPQRRLPPRRLPRRARRW